MGDDESWERVGKYVLETIKRHEQSLTDQGKILSIIAVDQGVAKVEKKGRQTLLTILGGFIPALGVALYFIIKDLIK